MNPIIQAWSQSATHHGQLFTLASIVVVEVEENKTDWHINSSPHTTQTYFSWAGLQLGR